MQKWSILSCKKCTVSIRYPYRSDNDRKSEVLDWTVWCGSVWRTIWHWRSCWLVKRMNGPDDWCYPAFRCTHLPLFDFESNRVQRVGCNIIILTYILLFIYMCFDILVMLLLSKYLNFSRYLVQQVVGVVNIYLYDVLNILSRCEKSRSQILINDIASKHVSIVYRLFKVLSPSRTAILDLIRTT